MVIRQIIRMDIATMNMKKNKLINKLKSTAGMSIAEVLIATLILLLVASGMTAGVSLANRQFRRSMQNSEAHELYASLESILTNELRYTRHINLSGNISLEDASLENPVLVEEFDSETYRVSGKSVEPGPDGRVKYDQLVALEFDTDGNAILADYGKLAFAYNGRYNELLSQKSYPNGLNAKAVVKYFRKDPTHTKANQGTFQVELQIQADGDQMIEKGSFHVKALSLE